MNLICCLNKKYLFFRILRLSPSIYFAPIGGDNLFSQSITIKHFSNSTNFNISKTWLSFWSSSKPLASKTLTSLQVTTSNCWIQPTWFLWLTIKDAKIYFPEPVFPRRNSQRRLLLSRTNSRRLWKLWKCFCQKYKINKAIWANGANWERCLWWYKSIGWLRSRAKKYELWSMSWLRVSLRELKKRKLKMKWSLKYGKGYKKTWKSHS